MGTSIKLNDSKFIDATGVYDSTLGKTQNNINTNAMRSYNVPSGTTSIDLSTISRTPLRNVFLIIPHGVWFGNYAGMYLLYTGSQSGTVFTVKSCSHLNSISYDVSTTTLSWEWDSYGGSVHIIVIPQVTY